MSHRGQIALLTVTVIVAAWSSEAVCQSRLSWQFYAGGVLPLSAYVHNGVRLDGDVTAPTGEDVTVSRLVEQYNKLGFQVGTTFLVNQFEISYSFNRMAWSREDTMCIGSGGVLEPIPGVFDDSLVDYQCSSGDPISTASLEKSSLDPLFLHVISVGYRYYFFDQVGRLESFVVAAPGLAISSYNDNIADDSNQLGFNLGLGVGLVVSLTDGFSVGLDARYNLLLTTPPVRSTQSANRAAARGQSAASSVLDAFHYVDLTAGVHIDFR